MAALLTAVSYGLYCTELPELARLRVDHTNLPRQTAATPSHLSWRFLRSSFLEFLRCQQPNSSAGAQPPSPSSSSKHAHAKNASTRTHAHIHASTAAPMSFRPTFPARSPALPAIHTRAPPLPPPSPRPLLPQGFQALLFGGLGAGFLYGYSLFTSKVPESGPLAGPPALVTSKVRGAAMGWGWRRRWRWGGRMGWGWRWGWDRSLGSGSLGWDWGMGRGVGDVGRRPTTGSHPSLDRAALDPSPGF